MVARSTRRESRTRDHRLTSADTTFARASFNPRIVEIAQWNDAILIAQIEESARRNVTLRLKLPDSGGIS